MSPEELVRVYQERQDGGDVEGSLALVADDAVFDVGRGHYVGKDQIRDFYETVLFPIHTETDGLEVQSQGAEPVVVMLRLSDDNTRHLQLEPIEVRAEYLIRDGKIAALHARPTPRSMETVRAIQRAGTEEASSQ
jgi:hypothetical protein